jgi:hypothetical protein
MPDKIYLGTDANGTLLASCDGIQIQHAGGRSRLSLKDEPAGANDRSLLLDTTLVIVASGRAEDIASVHDLRPLAAVEALNPIYVEYEDGASWTGNFAVEDWTETRPGGGEKRFTVRLVSDGLVAYTAP